jgi:predicted lactoylglutathione lyase
MAQMIFVNLPVRDLKRSTEFFSKTDTTTPSADSAS